MTKETVITINLGAFPSDLEKIAELIENADVANGLGWYAMVIRDEIKRLSND